MFLAQASFAQDANITQKIKDEGLTKSKVMETAFYLTDVSGPRLSNSPGLERAEKWAVDQLKSYGLQNVKLEPWGKFGKGWEIEKYYAAFTSPYYHNIIASPKAWTPSTNGLIKTDVFLMKADSLPDLAQFKGKLKGKIVLDAVYRPLETSLLAAAKKVGAKTVDGLEMLVHQAALQQEIWLGQRGDTKLMRDAALNTQ